MVGAASAAPAFPPTGQHVGMDEDELAATFHLTPALSNLLGLLMTVPTVRSRGHYKAPMFRLRKQLRGWDIKIRSRRYVGYWLDDEDKARIRALVKSLPGAGP
jgi:hypothetical protein